ncbi:MAG: protein phosphatase [Hyphomicrobiaceae bacterium TMED74]|nr:protein phosphatase [Filomicrobium sp.]RPG35597.1 MAG: protein phosphatase [Hyphomicrobiaceae bacterium TMED74]
MPLDFDQSHQSGPFDIIGDVHGCCDELVELLTELGYRVQSDGSGTAVVFKVEPPGDGRRVVFVGDLVDRGPDIPSVLRLVMSMVRAGQAYCVQGNHDVKFVRWLNRRDVQLSHGLDQSARQFEGEAKAFRRDVAAFLDGLPYQLILDAGKLVVAHAGIQEDMIGKQSSKVRAFCLYGDRGEGRDKFGLPIRYHWALRYTGEAAVVYGHTPVAEAEWVNNTICLDTGCVFGGQLTAMRWPELEVLSIPAKEHYVQRFRPFGHPPARPNY